MRTLQEKYNGVLADKFSKAQFKRDAIMECSHLVSHFNSFDDVVNILKNRGVIAEAKKEEPKYSTASAADHIAPDVLDTGIKFECDKKHGTLDISEEEYNKCRETAIKNLTKDVLYYVKQDSEQLPTPSDQMEKVTLKEEATGDLSDVMLRAQEYAAKKYPELDSDDIGDFLQLHGQEILDGDDLETSFDNYVDHNFPMNEENRYKVRLTTPHGDSAFVLGGKEMSSDEADLFIKRATNVAGMSKLEKVALEEVDATEKAASDKIGRGEEFTDDDAASVADKMPKIKKGTEFKLIGEDEPVAEDDYLATLKQRKALKEAVKGIIRNVLQS